MTRAVEGMTPYEAAFGKKPNLKGLWEWGEKVWVRIEGGNKLGGQVREGRWIGVDEQSKGMRIYWPDTKTITVERNIYFDDSLASDLEGEQAQTMKLTMNEIKANTTPTIVDPVTENNLAHAQRI
jgi:hypothetical protein